MTLVGTAVRRVEDERILRGQGRYVDDVELPGMLHVAFVRSPFARARVTRSSSPKPRCSSSLPTTCPPSARWPRR